MATLSWDDELAKLASLNVASCEFAHDCAVTEKYPYVGQNLGLLYDDEPRTLKDFILNRTNAFYNENVNATASLMETYIFE